MFYIYNFDAIKRQKHNRLRVVFTLSQSVVWLSLWQTALALKANSGDNRNCAN